jgi:hypothetical protein
MPAQLLSNVGGMFGKAIKYFDFFGLMDDDNAGKEKKKKAK